MATGGSRSLGAVVVAAATATCGLLLLGGVAPSGSALTPVPAAAPNPTTVPPAPPTTALPTTAPPTTVSPTTPPTTTPPTTTPATTEPPIVPTTPIPGSVNASNDIAGAGGVVTFDGTCPAGPDGPLGPVIVWVIGSETAVVDTGMTSSTWSYTWTAPVVESEFGSFLFQFWCGDPAAFDVGYPPELQRRVDMVAAAPPATTLPLVQSDDDAPLSPVLPETD